MHDDVALFLKYKHVADASVPPSQQNLIHIGTFFSAFLS